MDERADICVIAGGSTPTTVTLRLPLVAAPLIADCAAVGGFLGDDVGLKCSEISAVVWLRSCNQRLGHTSRLRWINGPEDMAELASSRFGLRSGLEVRFGV